VTFDDFDIGYEVRAEGQPFDEKATDDWKRGWRDADKEWSGEELDFESLTE
jgi:hypothetical protein